MSMTTSNCHRSDIVNEHSYSVQSESELFTGDTSKDNLSAGPVSYAGGTCNVSLDHAYTANAGEGFIEVMQDTETIEGIEYSTIRVPGDGNCFFSSLSVAINGNFSKTNLYRRLICTHVVENWELLKAIASIAHDLQRPLVNNYFQLMLVENGWGSVCEVKAACDVLRTNITVWLKGRVNGRIHYTMNRYQPTEISHENINLLLWGEHYTPLIPTGQLPAQAIEGPSTSRVQSQLQKRRNTNQIKKRANQKKKRTAQTKPNHN